jgi:hypothetical protein
MFFKARFNEESRFFIFIKLFTVQNSFNIRLKPFNVTINFIIFVALTKKHYKT